MNENNNLTTNNLTGTMLNAYPDSIGEKLSDIINLLARPELKDVFSMFYILPTFFNSDLDRGFSIIDYDLNQELVSKKDLEELEKLNITLKFDLILNHLSVASPQFLDLLKNGDNSKFKDFFIDWNEFWGQEGIAGEDGISGPKAEHLSKLFMRKPGLPILKVRFPDGSDRPYWNTFYQKISYPVLLLNDLEEIADLNTQEKEALVIAINKYLEEGITPSNLDCKLTQNQKEIIVNFLESNRKYLGQMDLNANSELVWEFYEDTFKKLSDYGAKIVRLDAFAYLHKKIGEINFFNKPGTWDYLNRLKDMSAKYGLTLLPEIHSEYGTGLHQEVASNNFPIYDFFFPGLVIDALDRGVSTNLIKWIKEIQNNNYQTINMLGCHDGIPVLDLKGKDGEHKLLENKDIDNVVDSILSRGGRVKNLYGPDGSKISYYQVNATFFSALGEDENKFLQARAIQMFMPGVPQVWYLDLFAGTNNYEAADKGGTGGHKEINRTTLSLDDVEVGLKKDIVKNQITLIKLRNKHDAFKGTLTVNNSSENTLELSWANGEHTANLMTNLKDNTFSVNYSENGEIKTLNF